MLEPFAAARIRAKWRWQLAFFAEPFPVFSRANALGSESFEIKADNIFRVASSVEVSKRGGMQNLILTLMAAIGLAMTAIGAQAQTATVHPEAIIGTTRIGHV